MIEILELIIEISDIVKKEINKAIQRELEITFQMWEDYLKDIGVK